MARKQPTNFSNQSKINTALAKWDRDKSINEFVRERLGLEGESGKTHAEEVIDNAILRAKIEERPEWTKLLLETVGSNEAKKDTGNTTNFIFAAADLTNQSLKKMIDVTPEKPKKSKIEELI